MSKERMVIMGAAGRDFHNFNTLYRNNTKVEVVAFTATQIPNIEGRTYPAVLSAADEVAVQAFLDTKIGFTDIPKVIDKVLSEHESLPGDGAEDFLEADRWAAGRTVELIGG